MQHIQGISNNAGSARRDIFLAAGLGVFGIMLVIQGVNLVFSGESSPNWLVALFSLLVGLALLGWTFWFGTRYAGYLNEQRAQSRIADIPAGSLSDEFIYFRNLVLPENRSIGEIDGVLLGPHGALVIEVASISGEYICERDTWYKYLPAPTGKTEDKFRPAKPKTKRQIIDSPTWHVIRAAREVKAWLSVRELPQVPVQPVVVLTRGKIIDNRQSSCPIIEQADFESFLHDSLFSQLAATNLPEITSGEVEQIAQRLKG